MTFFRPFCLDAKSTKKIKAEGCFHALACAHLALRPSQRARILEESFEVLAFGGVPVSGTLLLVVQLGVDCVRTEDLTAQKEFVTFYEI